MAVTILDWASRRDAHLLMHLLMLVVGVLLGVVALSL
jgi:hypothetical protein